MFKRKQIVDIIFWFFILGLLSLLHFSNGRLDSDNGLFMAGAWSLAHGADIYQDFFSFTTPGSYYLIMLAWKLLGFSYWVAWAAAISALFVSAVFIFKIGASFNRLAAYLAVLLFCLSTPLWPIISSHVFCLPFIFSAFYLVSSGIHQQRPIKIYGGALLAGLASLFLQTVGLATLAALFILVCLAVAQKDNRMNFRVLLIFLACAAWPLISLFLKWSPVLLFNSLVKFPWENYGQIISPNYWFFVMSCLFLLSFYLALHCDRKKYPSLSFLVIWQAFLLLSTLSFPDFYHLAFVLGPLEILAATLLLRILELREFRFSLRFLSVVVFLLYFFFYFFQAIYYSTANWSYFSFKEPEVITFIKSNCQAKQIYAGPFLPSVYFETRKLPVGPTHWLLTNHHSAEHFSQTLDGLERFRPDCVVVNYELVTKLNYDRNNPLDNYIANNYQSVAQFDNISVLRRVSE